MIKSATSSKTSFGTVKACPRLSSVTKFRKILRNRSLRTRSMYFRGYNSHQITKTRLLRPGFGAFLSDETRF